MATSSEVYNLIVSGNQSLNTEISSLTPSTPIFFYEIDLNEILPQFKASDQFSNGEQPVYNGILRGNDTSPQ